jgi:chorismate synthase
MSSMWGNKIKLSIFGESHAAAIGAVLDGIPAGSKVDQDALTAFMKRRSSQDSTISTPRMEEDRLEILCGIKDDCAEGTPISMMIRNENVRSQDYSDVEHICRPGHADYSGYARYHGFNDYRGGGHFSGRLTAPLVAAGGICKQVLESHGISLYTHIQQIQNVSESSFLESTLPQNDLAERTNRQFCVIEEESEEKMKEAIRAAQKEGNSVGGVVECMVVGLPAGIGSPMFDGLENRISSIIFGIPAVKGIEFGNGFEAAFLYGSENNDAFFYDDNGVVQTRTNRHGGILGGISTGMPLIFRVAFKPTPTIALEQETVNLSAGENCIIRGKGRHDPCIVPRAAVCVEAATAVAILDSYL